MKSETESPMFVRFQNECECGDEQVRFTEKH